ncbi:MAG: hypothetical protein QOJ97_730 [Solirubrobacteraceae bacterium]|jgi:hypothetical protein|nr:hypothetical protein [Solirubrobacteraceae bacterium]
MRGVLAAVALLAVAAPAAVAADYPTGWNGANPFVCELQQAGFGPVGPHPEADPYCVEFDKRRQNVTQLGVVDFLSQEPARVAAASDKCFYFQSDHWRGSVVQADGSTKTYEWDGHYFFDKARGEGGVWVTNFNINGRTQDPGQVPGIPAEYARWFGPGTGGMITRNGLQADPRCVEKAAKAPPYAVPPAGARGCLAAKGGLTSRAVGGVRLGDAESRVRAALGVPQLIRRGFLRWCYQDGTSLRVGQASDRSGDAGTGDTEPALALVTTSPAHRVRGVGPRSTATALRRAFRGSRRLYAVNGATVWRLSRTGTALAGVRHGRVAWLAVYDPAKVRSRATLREYLRRGT